MVIFKITNEKCFSDSFLNLATVLRPLMFLLARSFQSDGATCKNTLTSLGIKKGTDFSIISVDALFS